MTEACIIYKYKFKKYNIQIQKHKYKYKSRSRAELLAQVTEACIISLLGSIFLQGRGRVLSLRSNYKSFVFFRYFRYS